MRTWTKALAAVAVTVMLATPALAQQRQGGGRGFGMGGAGMGGAGIVGLPQVQQELGINDEQAGKIEPIVAELRETMQGVREQLEGVAPAERMEKARELMSEASRAAETKLAEVLDEGQAKRLKGIQLQIQGVQAFADAEVQKALELTEEQTQKVETLLADVNEQTRTIMQDAQGDFRGAMTRVREARDGALAKAKELLTEEQGQKWGEMTGEPFELTFGPGGPGGPGRGGRPNN